MMMVSQIFRKTETEALMIETLSRGVEEIKLANKFKSLKFQIKMYFHKVCCCSKKTSIIDREFYDLNKEFVVWEKRIDNYLSIDHMIS
jgi:hypothetical protein